MEKKAQQDEEYVTELAAMSSAASPSQSSSSAGRDDSCESDEKESETERGHWSHPAEFMLSLIGYCIGIGNVWRFPYVCIRNGGGTFLIPFFIFLFLCGMPLFFLELAIGQFSNLSPSTIWAVCPLFRGVGIGMCLISGVCSLYYNVIMAWSLFFIVKSVTLDALPWSHCGNEWNTPNCVDSTNDANATLNATTNVTMPASPSREFWELVAQLLLLSFVLLFIAMDMTTYGNQQATKLWNGCETHCAATSRRYILNFSDDSLQDYVTIHWPLFFLLLVCWLAICLTIINGIKTSGKVVYFTATVPFLMLFCLFVKSLTLPGASLGLRQLCTVDWYRLVTDINVWMSACLQVFYSLGPAWGGLITLSSFNKFNFNCYRAAIVSSCVDAGTCVVAAVVTFAVLGSMATKLGTDIGSVAAGGPGLAFIVYPEIVCQFAMPHVWSVMFFTMLLTLGIDSQFGTMETLVTGVFDYFPNMRKWHKSVTCIICLLWFILGIPMTTRAGLHLFTVIDYYCAAPSVIILALLECLALAFVYGTKRLVADITLMLGRPPWPLWHWMWRTITPLLLLCIVVFSCATMREPRMFTADGRETDYPTWLIAVGWISDIISIAPIPVMMIWEFFVIAEGTLADRWRSSTKSRPEWAPASSNAARMDYLMEHNRDSVQMRSADLQNNETTDEQHNFEGESAVFIQ